MQNFLNNFADALAELNLHIEAHRKFSPGIGPYPENKIVRLALEQLAKINLVDNYFITPTIPQRRIIGITEYQGLLNERAIPDLVIGNNIVEFKICRPIGDKGRREDTWFKKVFEPYYGSKSALSDAMKLCRFRDDHDKEKKWNYWVVIIGFERLQETEYNLDLLFPDLYRYLSEQILELPFHDYLSITREMGNRHPYHQVLKMYAFKY